VLLHDQTELPQVSDLGFAVGPGTHNLVAVERRSIIGLEQPYGECEVMARTRSHCLARCQAEQIEQQCQCRDIYMPRVHASADATEGTTFNRAYKKLILKSSFQ